MSNHCEINIRVIGDKSRLPELEARFAEVFGQIWDTRYGDTFIVEWQNGRSYAT